MVFVWVHDLQKFSFNLLFWLLYTTCFTTTTTTNSKTITIAIISISIISWSYCTHTKQTLKKTNITQPWDTRERIFNKESGVYARLTPNLFCSYLRFCLLLLSFLMQKVQLPNYSNKKIHEQKKTIKRKKKEKPSRIFYVLTAPGALFSSKLL